MKNQTQSSSAKNSGSTNMVETPEAKKFLYSFPGHGIQVEAISHAEAEKKLKKILSSHS